MCFNALLAIMEDSEIFSGEVTIDLAQSPLDEEAEWHYLTTYKNGLPDHLVSFVDILIHQAGWFPTTGFTFTFNFLRYFER